MHTCQPSARPQRLPGPLAVPGAKKRRGSQTRSGRQGAAQRPGAPPARDLFMQVPPDAGRSPGRPPTAVPSHVQHRESHVAPVPSLRRQHPTPAREWGEERLPGGKAERSEGAGPHGSHRPPASSGGAARSDVGRDSEPAPGRGAARQPAQPAPAPADRPACPGLVHLLLSRRFYFSPPPPPKPPSGQHIVPTARLRSECLPGRGLFSFHHIPPSRRHRALPNR